MVLVALLTFLLIDFAPGGYLDDLATNPEISAESIARMRTQFGLDLPFYRKFWRWTTSIAAGDFGYSFVYQRPVKQLIAERILNTILLNIVALTLARHEPCKRPRDVGISDRRLPPHAPRLVARPLPPV